MRIISVLTALALSQTGLLSAQESGRALTKDPLYQEALSALTDHLPLIASEKFTKLIKQKTDSLTKEQHLELIFLLAESQVRANKPQEAIQSLSNKLIAENPDAIFWRGQALAATGRYNEAIETLEKASPKSKNYQLGQLKIANLAISLGDIDKALNILLHSIKNSKNVSSQTYLSVANLYIAKQDSQNAADILAKTKPTDPIYVRAKQVLLAQVDLLQENYDSAIPALEKILSEENLQSNTVNFAALQLADALHASGKKQEAINTLINHLDKQPGQLMSPMFTRLGKWLPSDTSITDPTIKKLMEWANLATEQVVDPLNPLSENQIDLSAFAHYHYAKFLSNKSEPTNKTKAILEFDNLRLRYPTHILAGTSLSDTATTQLALGKIEEAKDTLQRIQELTSPIAPIAKQHAGFLLGKLNLDDQNYAGAAAAYQAIVDSASGNTKAIATMNAANSYLAATDLEGYSKLKENIQDPNVLQNLKLEHALWLARNNRPDARINLHEFSLEYAKHPRIHEAHLSLALHCLNVSPVDIQLSRLTSPKIDQSRLTEDQMVDFYYLKYRNAVSQKDFASAAEIAQQFLDLYPEHSRVPEFTLHQGQALYHNGQHNAARQILDKMVKTYPEHPLKDFAEYYAAMSAKQEGTPQSAGEAIEKFSKISQSSSHLATEARLQLARLYTSTNESKLAIDTLNPVYQKQAKNEKDLDLSLTLASAYQTMGDSDEQYLQSALDIYDALITQFAGNDQIINEIKYNQARLLQHMKQEEKALSTYYSVINIDIKKNPITEWHYYFECGFRAITMLENMENPKAAIAIANKLAESKGRRAQEAANRARDLEMKHMIWQN